MQQADGVRDERLQIIAGVTIFLVNLFERQRLGSERFQYFIVLAKLELKLLTESLLVDQIDDAQSGSRCFVAVSGSDSAFGGADFVFAFQNFALHIELAVVRKNKMRGFAQKQISINTNTELSQPFNFFDEAYRVNDYTIA